MLKVSQNFITNLVYAVMKEVKMRMGRREVRFLEDGREWRLSGLFYTGDLVLCGESEEDLGAVVGRFVEVCKRRGQSQCM